VRSTEAFLLACSGAAAGFRLGKGADAAGVVVSPERKNIDRFASPRSSKQMKFFRFPGAP
jgi:hypothetical protein